MQVIDTFSDQFVLAILFGCFVQVATILVLLKSALGLNQLELSIVTIVLSLVISAAFVQHKFQTDSINLSNENFKTKISDYMLEKSDPALSARLPATLSSDAEDGKDRFFIIQAVFLLSQFKAALSVGVLLIIPLFLIDFLVAVALNLAGIQNLAVQTVAVPLKLLLLASVGAWDMLISKLLTGFI